MKEVAAGRKAATAAKNPDASLAGNSAGYKYGYVKGYNAKLKKHPEYVYNTKTVYVHSKADFTNNTRTNKYTSKPRNQVHEFKIERIALSKSGLVRYYVKNHLTTALNKNKGYLTANRNYIVNAYYSKDEMKQAGSRKVKVISDKGIRIHSDKAFSSNDGKYYKQGKSLHVDRVENYKGLTRFYIGNGKYITRNLLVTRNLLMLLFELLYKNLRFT
ncbi:DUF5776 domain-containing protein [Lactobacillaceae bacterium Scapto_B20]